MNGTLEGKAGQGPGKSAAKRPTLTYLFNKNREGNASPLKYSTLGHKCRERERENAETPG